MKTPDSSAKSFLIVEDEPEICDLCRRVLSGEGFEVDIAVNGKVALDMIEEQQYGLHLFDIKLPEMNGIELYQWLKEKHPQLASTVIFTTGSVIDKNTTAYIEQTSRPFLPKPFTPDELRTVARETLKRLKND